jgi:hypothetical protein
MKRLRLGFAVALLLGSAPVVMALDKPLFDVCVNPLTAVFVPSSAPPGPIPGIPPPGSLLTAAGIIVPTGTIPAGGARSDCSDVEDARIGTFFVRGNIVAGLPAAADDDLAYVSWQFTVGDKDVLESTGPVKTTSPYFQPVAAATGSFHQFRDRQLRTDVLDATGFQFRVTAVNK